MPKETFWKCPDCGVVWNTSAADYNGIFVCSDCYKKVVGELEPEPPEALGKFGPNDWGQSTEIVFDSEHGDRIYLRLEVVAGKLKVNFGDFDISLDEIEKFVEFIQSAPTLYDSIIVRDTSKDKVIPASPIVQFEIDRMTSHIKDLFNRDDVFFKKLK